MKVKELANIVRKNLKLLGPSRNNHQINLTPKHDGSAHIEDFPNGKYRHVYSERGQEYNERITDNPKDILYWIYQDATFEIACDWEVNNRIPDQDVRRLIFSKQLELLKILAEDFAARREKEIETILLNHPYND